MHNKNCESPARGDWLNCKNLTGENIVAKIRELLAVRERRLV